MAKPADDFEAVRIVVEALKEFDQKDQERIFRWASEKLGLTDVPITPVHTPQLQPPGQPIPAAGTNQDIRSFMAAKDPKSDVQRAAVVAYFYQFEAPPTERKTAISSQDLQDALRKAGKERLKYPLKTLQNARMLGMLDTGEERGSYTINAVGENLVAMTLPDGAGIKVPRKKKRPRTKVNKA